MESKRCCFTGHRSEKLNVSEREVKKLLRQAINEAIEDGFLTYITGMSRGIDMWAAEIVLSIKKHNKKGAYAPFYVYNTSTVISL